MDASRWGRARADADNDKWARARAIVAKGRAVDAQCRSYREAQGLDARFAHCGPSKVVEMFENGSNDNGRPLAALEFRALCERRCAVVGEISPLSFQPGIVGAIKLKDRVGG